MLRGTLRQPRAIGSFSKRSARQRATQYRTAPRQKATKNGLYLGAWLTHLLEPPRRLHRTASTMFGNATASPSRDLSRSIRCAAARRTGMRMPRSKAEISGVPDASKSEEKLLVFPLRR